MSKSFLLIAFSLLGVASACQRKPNLIPTSESNNWKTSAFENVMIDSSTSSLWTGPCEPSIAISPKNPQQIVAGAVLDQVYRSNDGGKTWSKKTLTSTYGVFGDPSIIADFKGNFYYAHLSDPTGRQWSAPELLDRIVIQKSTDGGTSWNGGGFTGMHHPKDQDKQWLGIDPRNNQLYASWTEFDLYESKKNSDKSRILFSTSTNDGATWSDAKAISQLEGDCLDDDNTTEGAVPAVGPNGEVYVAWAYQEKIFFDRSLDGGKTWLDQDIVVATQPGGWTFDVPGIFRANGLPITATDLSNGPNRGAIYINWSDQRNGENDTDIWLAKSTDGGKNWSKPIRVNDDEKGKQQFFSWLAVDPITGYLYVVFYDRRAYDDERTDVYLAVSKDGGLSFDNKKISASPFKPSKGVFFGDYNHLSAYNGVVRPIWTRCTDGHLSIWTALINLK
jgi:hypothetical protein